MATLIKTITDALGNIILPRTRAEAVTLEDGVTTIQDVVDTADAHYANTSNPHSTTAVQVGADPTGTASTAVSNHVAASDPHTQYLKENPTAAEVGALPIPDAGGYYSTDTIDGALQSVGSQLAQKANTADPTFTGLITTAGQIKFPATQSASSDPNTLDDYEEGRFTPTVIGSTTTGVGTYTEQHGRYVKIGNKVTITMTLSWTQHTGSGEMQVTGLPFGDAVSVVRTAFNIIGENLSYTNQLVALDQWGTNNTIQIFQITGGIMGAVPLDTNVSYLVISGSYFTL